MGNSLMRNLSVYYGHYRAPYGYRHSPTVGFQEGVVSCEQGTPVGLRVLIHELPLYRDVWAYRTPFLDFGLCSCQTKRRPSNRYGFLSHFPAQMQLFQKLLITDY